MKAELLKVKFSFLADDMLGPVTDYDVAMAYDFFLGRPPENSTAINSHKQLRFNDMIREFILSGEFTDATYQNLIKGHPISRLDNTRSPSRQQLSWITKKMIVTEEERTELYAAESWGEFFNKFLAGEGLKSESPYGENTIEPISDIVAIQAINNDGSIVDIINNIETLLGEIKSMIQKT